MSKEAGKGLKQHKWNPSDYNKNYPDIDWSKEKEKSKTEKEIKKEGNENANDNE